MRLEPVLHSKRSHLNEKLAHGREEQLPLAVPRESNPPAATATKTECSQKKKKKKDQKPVNFKGGGAWAEMILGGSDLIR